MVGKPTHRHLRMQLETMASVIDWAIWQFRTFAMLFQIENNK
jgi:hypothetical protein